MTPSEEPSRLRHLFKKFDILIFYIIAFTITWTGWLVMDTIITCLGGEAHMSQLFFEGHYYLILCPFLSMGAVWGPLISAFIVYSVNYGKAGLRELLKKVFNWRVAIPWYLIAIGVPILIKYGAFYFNVWFLGGTFVSDFERVSILVILLKFFEELVPSGGQEEVGWTGFAQLRMQQQFSVIPATLIKALLGWIWHLPLYLVFPWSGVYGSDIWIFLIYYIPTAFILTWLFNNTDSVLIPALFHASFNTIGANASTGFTSMSNVTLTLLVLSALTFLVVILAFIKDGKNLTKKELPTFAPAHFQEMKNSES
jgi:membrane protease YdiL (CAAX protease family)